MVDSWSFLHSDPQAMSQERSIYTSSGVATPVQETSAQELGSGTGLSRCLVSQLFDASCSSTIEQMQRREEICIPWGNSIVFPVAKYRDSLNIPDCYQEYHIPSTEMYKLQNLKFDDFSLNDEEMLKACLRMFMDLGFVQRFGIKYDVLYRWLLSVRKNYSSGTYTWRHAFNVAQMMFTILTVSKLGHVFGELETLPLLIACLCHDLDTCGTNNSFFKKHISPLANLYSTSIMEHHHFDQCIMILNSEGNQILGHLSPKEYMTVVHVLENAILATDLTVHYKRQLSFTQLVRKGNYKWTKEDNRELLREMLMTACDIAAITKPWKVQKK
ncbi:dual 3',5'-cyclic-AMP and -GMP phosphodiesterase 11, partial [Caerostris darwini]